MSADRNKTELTQNITRNVALWLSERGFRPVETEVEVESGWVADVAGVICPTISEMIALKLVKRPPSCPFNAAADKRERFHVAYESWNRERGELPPALTALVEVKSNVGDYRGDRKWSVDQLPADLCYVAMPEGMIPPEQWPEDWGVILFSADGARVVRTVAPHRRALTVEKRLSVVVSLAVSRDNKTRFSREREWQKEVRAQESDRRTVARVSDSLRAVIDVAKGVPVGEALVRNRIAATLPDDLIHDLATLQAKCAPRPLSPVPVS